MLMRHKKSGDVYRVEMFVTDEANLAPLVVYSDVETGTLWSRPAKEFFDGRYERVIAPKPSKGDPGPERLN